VHVKIAKLKKSIIYTVIAVVFFLGGACAKMGSMSGGIKDVDPPVLLSSKPANYSVNFKSQKIELVFDEFIQLKNVNQELIISPPLPKKPDVRLKEKSIIIDLKNDLRENTTYTLNFGKAIADNNEGNPLTNFEFVFSTGSYLDSLSVKGHIVNAFNLQPSKDPFIVGLYDQTEDSVPIKTIPVYVGKTDEKGRFRINNLKADTFKVFALKDLNYNLRFDLPTEEIAFLDTFLYLSAEYLKSLPAGYGKSDSIRKDTALVKSQKDTKTNTKKRKLKSAEDEVSVSAADNTDREDSMQNRTGLPALYMDMFSFLPENSKLYMTNSSRVINESLQFSFSLPLKYPPKIDIFNYESTKNWFLPEVCATRDTFTYWITDTTLIKRDTLKFAILYPATDSAGNIYTRSDTLKYLYKSKSSGSSGRSGKGKGEEKNSTVKLTVFTLRNNGILDYKADLPFGFNFPLARVDTAHLHLFANKDSVEHLQSYMIETDTAGYRKLHLISKWEENTRYRLLAMPGAFTDIYGHRNDSLQTKFTQQLKSYYGTLTVTLSGIKIPVIVQLMNEKEQVLRTSSITADGSVTFEYLLPAVYKLKFVFDRNGNNKWDTGDYLKGIQPETVRYYTGDVNIRSNWELEVKEKF
jgi:hypothetical protein